MRAHQLVLAVRIVAGCTIAIFALSTPGFTSPLSINSLLNAISFIGCVAVGMTFITITGNIMSLALGATVSASALVFLASLSLGVFPAFLVAILFGVVITAVQGALVGYIRANPLLVSIAALSLLIGGAALATGGQRIYPGGEGLQIFKGRVFGIPVEALYFFATVVIGQFVLSWTRIGREMVMVGSNPRAAIAAGIDTARAITLAYVLAGAFSAVAGILLAARYGSGDMELGLGYDYTAIAAVLVGGTAIQGGSGSVVRTLIGVTVIAVIATVLLLRGYSQQWQYLITGLIVLAVIMLHTIGERR
jgi:ribose/xylose/arabinose/galactoside ABC-type transport system permease subunit